jgi:hypothetical protein
MANHSTLNAAIPYAIASLGIATIGIIGALSTTSTVLAVVGAVAAVFGAVATFGIIASGLMNPGNPQQFRKDLPKFTILMVAGLVAEMIRNKALEVISTLVYSAFKNQSNSVRVSHI